MAMREDTEGHPKKHAIMVGASDSPCGLGLVPGCPKRQTVWVGPWGISFLKGALLDEQIGSPVQVTV